ncbi:MAG: hypothetical protein M0Z82_07210, partial [Actinomycetota bacterium]|nr:hypothetical protein [Actinomycetota bacterium]
MPRRASSGLCRARHRRACAAPGGVSGLDAATRASSAQAVVLGRGTGDGELGTGNWGRGTGDG